MPRHRKLRSILLLGLLILLPSLVVSLYFLTRKAPKVYLTEAGRLRGHTDYISSMAFSPNGRMLVSSSRDGTIRLWNTESWTQAYSFVAPKNYVVNSAAFSPDGRLLAAGFSKRTTYWYESDAGILQIWNVKTKQTDQFKQRLPPVRAVAFSPNGSLLAAGFESGEIRLFDPKSGSVIYQFNTNAGENGNGFIAFTLRGELVASDIYYAATLWDVTSGRQMRRFGDMPLILNKPALSPDGTLLAQPQLVPSTMSRAATIMDNILNHLGFSTRQRVPEFKAATRIWDIGSGREIHRIRDPDAGFHFFAFSPDGKLLAGAFPNDLTYLANPGAGIYLWDTHSWRRTEGMDESYRVGTLTFSPEGRLLAGAGMDNVIHVWRVKRL